MQFIYPERHVALAGCFLNSLWHVNYSEGEVFVLEKGNEVGCAYNLHSSLDFSVDKKSRSRGGNLYVWFFDITAT
ncbi:MAG: hypothetical protein KDB90_09455 [Planctomycetes bacterium]|nr:hypothetical protein [Planctomycetota bacterium]